MVGQHNITATYAGDFNFEGSSSGTLVQVITGVPTSTSLLVTPNPTSAFSPIVLGSVVHSEYGFPTGSVVFTANGNVLGTATLDSSGAASVTVSSLGTGTYPIVANYTADTLFQRSSSAPVQEVVTGLDTVVALTGVPNPMSVNQAVILARSFVRLKRIQIVPPVLSLCWTAPPPLGRCRWTQVEQLAFPSPRLALERTPLPLATAGRRTSARAAPRLRSR